MLQIVFIVVIAIYIFRTARQYDRNPYLWAGVAVLAFFGIQIFLGFLIGIGLMIGVMTLGWSESIIYDNTFFIGVVCAIPAFIAVWFISKRVSVVKDEPIEIQPPPPDFPQS